MAFWNASDEESLATALEKNNVSKVAALLDKGTDANYMLLQYPDALVKAAAKQSHEAVGLFLGRTGIPMTHRAVQAMEIEAASRPKKGTWWPLYHGEEETKEWVKVLGAAGSTFTAKTKDGQAFLHVLLEPYTSVPNSTMNGQESRTFIAICKMLPGDLREKLNAPDNMGRTPLHYAAKIIDRSNSTIKLIEFMLKNGADPRYTDKAGVTAESVLMLYSGGNLKAAIDAAKTAFPAIDIDEEKTPEVTPVAEVVSAPAASAPAPIAENGWIGILPDSIAYVENMPALGYKLTDIFNFSRRERVSLSQNLSSGSESRETKAFDDIGDKSVLEKAHDAYVKQGGAITRDVIYPIRNIKKDISL